MRLSRKPLLLILEFRRTSKKQTLRVINVEEVRIRTHPAACKADESPCHPRGITTEGGSRTDNALSIRRSLTLDLHRSIDRSIVEPITTSLFVFYRLIV